MHLGEGAYKLIANIPYYITGYLFRLFLEALRQPTLIVFLVQKEVAEQIIATNKKEGLLSLSVKAFGSPHYVATVQRDAFSPPPKVDSAIMCVDNISRSHFSNMTSKAYFTILKAGLGAKRKMLLGNLAQSLGIPKTMLGGIFLELGISQTARGEDLSIEAWLALAMRISRITETMT